MYLDGVSAARRKHADRCYSEIDNATGAPQHCVKEWYKPNLAHQMAMA